MIERTPEVDYEVEHALRTIISGFSEKHNVRKHGLQILNERLERAETMDNGYIRCMRCHFVYATLRFYLLHSC